MKILDYYELHGGCICKIARKRVNKEIILICHKQIRCYSYGPLKINLI